MTMSTDASTSGAADLPAGRLMENRAIGLLVHGDVACLRQILLRFGQRGRRRVREHLGRLVHFVSGQAVRLAQFRQRRALIKRIRRTDHRDPIAAPPLVHPADHLVVLIPRQIQVDVGHLLNLARSAFTNRSNGRSNRNGHAWLTPIA